MSALNSRDWPVWYLRENLAAAPDLLEQATDDQLVRWWHALHMGAPRS